MWDVSVVGSEEFLKSGLSWPVPESLREGVGLDQS